MQEVREIVKSTLLKLKSRGLPIGAPSYRKNGSVWRKVKASGQKSPWKQIKAPLKEAVFKPTESNQTESKNQKTSPNGTFALQRNQDNQPLLFDSKTFSKKPQTKSTSQNSVKTHVPKPVFVPKEIGSLSGLIEAVQNTLKQNGLNERAEEFFERSKNETNLNNLLNLSYKYVNLSSLDSNKIIRSVVSRTVKETKKTLSEAILGNDNAKSEHDVKESLLEIKSNNLKNIVGEFENVPLSPENSEFVEQVRDSLSKNLIPPLISSKITDTISKLTIKEPSIVLKILKNYIKNSLLNYNKAQETKKIDDTTQTKRTVLATKFRNLADSMEESILNKENPPISRQNVTNRRSRIAESMREDSIKMRKIQGALRGIAHEIEEGILPESLKTLRTKTDIQNLLSVSNSIASYRQDPIRTQFQPVPEKFTMRIYKLSKHIFQEKDDIKIRSNGSVYGHSIYWAAKNGLISKEDLKIAENFRLKEGDGEGEGKDFILTDDLKEVETLKRVKEQVKKIESNLYAKPLDKKTSNSVEINGKNYNLYFKGKVYSNWNDTSHSVLKLGFKTNKEIEEAGEHLKKLIKDFTKEGLSKKEIEIKNLERELVGKKISGFFPTPKSLALRMLEAAEIKPGMEVLEPSAGKGDIADLLKTKEGITPDTIEINYELKNILSQKGHKVVSDDFLEYNDKQYDRILMNPPFEKGQDIDHIKHAYTLLKPGGILVSIASEGPFFRTDNKSKEFRKWLEKVDAGAEKLPQGSFTGGEAFRQTGVSTRLVTIVKGI